MYISLDILVMSVDMLEICCSKANLTWSCWILICSQYIYYFNSWTWEARTVPGANLPPPLHSTQTPTHTHHCTDFRHCCSFFLLLINCFKCTTLKQYLFSTNTYLQMWKNIFLTFIKAENGIKCYKNTEKKTLFQRYIPTFQGNEINIYIFQI